MGHFTFSDVLKFNPYHDSRGRFASANSATSFTIRTKDPSKQGLADRSKEREKERDAAEAPKETPRMQAIHNAEDQIRHQNYETAVVIDKDGNEVMKKDGGQNSVGFSPMECFMLRNNTLTHNHPRSSMFSMEDTLCFVKNELEEIRATTREGVTFSIKRGEGYSKGNGLAFAIEYDGKYKKAINFAQNDLDNRGFRDMIQNGEITHDQANTEFSRVVTNQMVQWTTSHASEYGINFSVEKRTVTKSFDTGGFTIGKAEEDDEFLLDGETARLEDEAFQEWLEQPTVAKTFDEVLKFNPYHDAKGRFSNSNSAASFTYAPGKSTAHDKAISREKEADAAEKGFKGRLYHGSPNKNIKEFDMSRAGNNTSSGEKLLFFTDSKQLADDFSYERLDGSSKFLQRRGEKGRIYEVDVEMKNPLDFRKLSDADIDNILKLDADGLLDRKTVEKLAGSNHQLLKAGLTLTAESLSKLGYDGLIANMGKSGHNALEYAVVDSKQAQIKKSNRMEVEKVSENDSLFIYKSDEDKRLVFGWASVSIDVDGEQLEDRQHDMIDPEVLEEAAYEYVLEFRDGGEEHIPSLRKKARLVESCVFTEEKQKAMGIPPGILPVAWWIGFYVDDDEAWAKIKDGTYRMFSIEGKAKRVPVEKSAPPEQEDPDRFDHIKEFP